MGAPLKLSHRDLDRVLGVVREAAPADGGQPFELAVIERLLELVPADRAGYYEYEGGGGQNRFLSEKPSYDFRWPGTSPLVLSWPLNDWRLASRKTPAIFSDFVPGRARRRHPWYAQVMRPREIEFECKLLLPAEPGVVRGFFFIRGPGRRDFNERDRTALALLRPHLAEVRAVWQRKREPQGLTVRETEIVRLLARGLTNREIADQLCVATGTVRRHLENVFEKLDVHTRTAAVARAFGQR
jgi:DNA-binding CsgD family transcriptional regulator